MKRKAVIGLLILNAGIIIANIISNIDASKTDGELLVFLKTLSQTNNFIGVQNWVIYLVVVASIICTYLTMLEKSRKGGVK